MADKTFAQRAQDLVKKYSRADFDSIEKQELDSALQSLQQEQETYREINGMNDNQFACGGKMYQAGGDLPLITMPPGISNTGLSSMINIDQSQVAAPDSIYDPINLTLGTPRVEAEPFSPATPIAGTVPRTVQEGITPMGQANIMGQTTTPQPGGEFTPYSTSILPSLISGATTGIGNLIMAGQQEGSLPRINLPRVSAPEISYAPGRAAARREASRAKSQARYGTARAARTRGELLRNVGTKEATISGQLGETLAKSQAEEALVNANMEAGMNKANAEIAAREQIFNAQQQAREQQSRDAYISAAIQTIPQTVRDITATRSQDRLLNTLGQDYGWYMYKDPNAKWYQRKRPVVGFRGGNNVRLARGYNR